MLTEGYSDVAVSTILENIFQYFDDDLLAENGRYSQLEREIKLRTALFVFAEMGLTRPSDTDKSLPMLVPSKYFMEALGTSCLTTLVKPLHLPVNTYIHRSEVEEYDHYEVDFRRSFQSLEGASEHLVDMKIWLRLGELGWAEHARGSDERLCWKLTKSGIENRENGAMTKLLLSERHGKN